MTVVFAILLGAVAGVVGFLPLFAALRLSRRATQATNIGQLGICLMGVFTSFGLLAVACYVFSTLAHPFTLPFVLSVAVVLSGSAIYYGLAKMRMH